MYREQILREQRQKMTYTGSPEKQKEQKETAETAKTEKKLAEIEEQIKKERDSRAET